MFAIATIDKKAVKKIGDAAKYYKQHFNEKNLLVIYGQFEEGKIQLFPMLSYMEIYATKSNFFHLTGLEDTSGNQRFDKKEFFNNAIKYKIASNFDYRDENTELKLEVILKALNYTGNFRMSGDYNHGRPNLETDILVGGQHCCLGFIEDENGYYRPNTVLEADVRNEIIESNQVLAIMQKEPKDKTYTQICYLKNDVYAHKLFREFCTRNPDAPVSQHTINYSTLLPRQQAKEQVFFALEQKEEQKKEIKALLDSIADSRKKAIINNDENALGTAHQYQNPKQITTNRKTKSQSKSRIYLKQFLLNRQFRRIFQTILSQKKTKLYAQSLSRQQVRKQRKCHHSFLNNFLSR